MAARYWVGGSNTWTSSNTANWSTTSGGTGGATVPGSGDDVIIDSGSGSGVTVTLQAGYSPTVLSVTLTQNTLYLNNNTLTATAFSSSNSNVRSLNFGFSGQLTLTGNNATVLDTGTDTNLSIFGSRNVYLTYAGSTGTRTVVTCPPDSLYTNALNFYVTAGSDTVSFGSTGGLGMAVGILNYSGFSGVGTASGYISGNFTYSASASAPTAGDAVAMFLQPSGSSTITVDTANVQFDLSITVNPQFANGTVTFVRNVTCTTATRVLTLVQGFIDLQSYNVGINFGRMNLNSFNYRGISWGYSSSLTLFGFNGTVVDFSNLTNYNVSGYQPPLTLTYTGSTGTRTITGPGSADTNTAFNLAFTGSATDTVSLTGTWYTGTFSGFSGTLANTQRTFLGSLAFANTVTMSGGALATTMSPNSGATQTLTRNGSTVAFPLVIVGGGTVQLSDAYTSNADSNCYVSLQTGTLALNGFNLDVWALESNQAAPRGIYTGGANINLWGTGGNILDVTNSGGWQYYDQVNVYTKANTTVAQSVALLSDTSMTEYMTFNVNVGAARGNISISGAYQNLTFANTFTGVNLNATQVLFGNLTQSNAMTNGSGTNAITFASSLNKTQYLTTNGVDVNASVISYVQNGNLSLVGNVITLATNSVTLNGGNLLLGNTTVNTGAFISSTYTTRNLAFGPTGNLNLLGNNTNVLYMPIATNFTYTGNLNMNILYSGSSGTRYFDFGSSVTPAQQYIIPLTVPNAHDTVGITGYYTNISVANISGSWIGEPLTLYGNLTTTGSSPTVIGHAPLSLVGTNTTQTLNTNGINCGIDYVVNVSNTTVTLASNLVSNSMTLNSGNLDLNNQTANVGTFTSSTFNGRNLGFRTSGVLNLTANNTTVLDMGAASNFTYSGTANVNATYSGSSGTRSFNLGTTNTPSTPATDSLPLNITNGGDTVSVGGYFNDLTIANVTGTLINQYKYLYGNYTVSGTPAVSGYTGTQFNGENRTQTVDTNSIDLLSSYDINCSNATVKLNSGFVAEYINLNSGNLNTNNATVSTNVFNSSSGSSRGMILGNSVINVNGVGNIWQMNAFGMNLVSGTSTINLTNTSANRTFSGGSSLTYGNINIEDSGTLGTTTVFQNNITIGNIGGTINTKHDVRFTGGSTTTVGGWTLRGSANAILGITSTDTTQHNLILSGGIVSTRYLSVSLSNAAPVSGNVWWAGPYSQDLGQNRGWTFPDYPATTEGQFFFIF